ncbi:MAG TPA: hypothetical protein VED02_05370, partial [Methyloceanibacter sp.]|nr:hypothetical protein [Methyloceanibacter sp.]
MAFRLAHGLDRATAYWRPRCQSNRTCRQFPLRALADAGWQDGDGSASGRHRWACLGIFISKRQVVRLLTADQDEFLTEAREVLRAGLSSADWITVDNTGARHKATNGFCTQIGNEHFAWFGTTGSKSRLNFLELLRAGHGDY